MRQDPPKRKLLREAARHADPAESDARDRSDVGNADGAEPAHRTARRGRRLRDPDSEASYAVGYGRPPKDGQFKPGQSGHPQGRAPKSRNLNSIVKQVLDEKVELREGGRTRKMAVIEALVRVTRARAFKDDFKAFASLTFMMKQTGYGTEAKEVSAELPANVDYDAVIKEFLSRLGGGEPIGDDPSAEGLGEFGSAPKKDKP